jgi:glycosyltransferase involved in cell wall biosynthesis
VRVGVNCLFMIPGEVGGAETYLRQTLASMAAGFPDKVLVLFTNRENDRALREEFSPFGQIRFVNLDFPAMNRYARIVREQVDLPRKVKASGVDVLWSPGYTSPRYLSVPAVTSILDMQYKSHPEDLTPLARFVTDLLVRSACRRSRAIITISEFSKREIVRHTGMRPERIHVTPLAADAVFGEPLPPGELRQRLVRLLGYDGPYLLAVSNTYPHKNIAAAVKAFGEVMYDIPHRLVLVGQPRLGEGAVQKECALLGDRGRLHRLRYLAERSDLRALYQGADIFLLPSLYEGFGLPVLEAMMSGTPVIAARSGAVEEVAGECVEFFDHRKGGDLAAGIMNVLSWRGKERESFVSRGRVRSREFSWEKTAERTMEALTNAGT